MCYPAARLWEETAFIAYHFHWTHDDIMSLSHADRQKWCAQITDINRQANNEGNAFALV